MKYEKKIEKNQPKMFEMFKKKNYTSDPFSLSKLLSFA